tara:strand:+ start:99 stop:485 length:387 start_codon:yes stop_codon:yes gene_type:complete
MKKILIEVSIGELLDKLSILEIKLEKITDKESLKIIQKEYESLKKVRFDTADKEKYKDLYKELKSINEKLWNIENEKRLCEKESDFTEKFIMLSRDVHFNNDKRAKIKSEINKLLQSSIQEIKEYTKY